MEPESPSPYPQVPATCPHFVGLHYIIVTMQGTRNMMFICFSCLRNRICIAVVYMEERIKIFMALKFVVPSPNPNMISYA